MDVSLQPAFNRNPALTAHNEPLILQQGIPLESIISTVKKSHLGPGKCISAASD